jgi:chromosome partitioning protein
MPVIVVANPKGGVGKSTLASNIAGYWARCGHAVMLGDCDRQQSARLWLGLRPDMLPPIRSWEVTADHIARPPRGTTHAVLDTPAGLHGWRQRDVLKLADKILVPLQPSVFDIFATQSFIDLLREEQDGRGFDIGVVGVRVDERTLAAEQLRLFCERQQLPVLGHLRDTTNYVQLAARGLTLWDVAPSRVEKDLQQWEPIVGWIDAGRSS